MLPRAVLPIAVILGLASHGTLALDLTPRERVRVQEGVKIPIIMFLDDEKKIGFRPPLHWHLSGGGHTLNLFPPQADTLMQMRVIPKPAAEESLDELENWCRSTLPKDAANITRDWGPTSVFTLSSHASTEFTFSYASEGRRFTTSVAVVDVNDKERLVVTVTARKSEFWAIHVEAMRSMFTWRELDQRSTSYP